MDVRGMTVGIREGCLAGIIAFSGITLARAEETIGVAALVRNEVDQALPTRVIRINAGENINRDEVVKTGPDSAAKLVFSDNTNLSMGPASTLTLNKFVYSGANTYEKATFQLAKGVFRFTTGASDKHAYEIKTPTATIGVRGTVLDIKVDAQTSNTTVVLQEGAADVCMVSLDHERNRRDRKKVGSAAGCANLSRAGQTATATSNSVSTTRGAEGSGDAGGAGGWSFSKSVGEEDLPLLQPTSYAVAMSTNASRGDGADGNGAGSASPGGNGFGGSGPGGIGAGGGGGGSVFPPVGTSASPN
jgi:hypothetical protein